MKSVTQNIWLYFNSKTVGGNQAFNKRSLDVPINVNRYFQINKAIKNLVGQTEKKASFQKVWDNRMFFLTPKRKIYRPLNLEMMERLIEDCYLKAKTKL